MPIIISHASALSVYRGNPLLMQNAARTTEPVLASDGTEKTLSWKQLRTRLDRIGAPESPIHLIGTREAHGTRGGNIILHRPRSRAIQAGLLLYLGDDIYLSSPELCFVQMSAELSQLSSIVLAYELCGDYSHFTEIISGFYKRPALTSTSRISETLSQLRSQKGVNRARKSLAWALDGSASPMETVAACAMLLPKSLGGYNLEKPQLNYKVDLDRQEAELIQSDYVRVDIAWPEHKIGYEYDSDLFHQDPAKDRRRREALAHKGWTIFTFDTRQLGRYTEFAKTIELARGSVRERQSERRGVAGDKRALFSKLMTLTRAGLGLERALFSVPVELGSVAYYVS